MVRKTHKFINKVGVSGVRVNDARIARDVLDRISHIVWTDISMVEAGLKDEYEKNL